MHYYYTFKFFNFLKDQDYEKAFNMLEENNKKDDFENDINKFKNIVSVLDFSNIKDNNYDYSQVNVYYQEDFNSYVDIFRFNKKEIYVYTNEYSNYEFKIQLCVIDGEGL